MCGWTAHLNLGGYWRNEKICFAHWRNGETLFWSDAGRPAPLFFKLQIWMFSATSSTTTRYLCNQSSLFCVPRGGLWYCKSSTFKSIQKRNKLPATQSQNKPTIPIQEISFTILIEALFPINTAQQDGSCFLQFKSKFWNDAWGEATLYTVSRQFWKTTTRIPHFQSQLWHAQYQYNAKISPDSWKTPNAH